VPAINGTLYGPYSEEEVVAEIEWERQHGTLEPGTCPAHWQRFGLCTPEEPVSTLIEGAAWNTNWADPTYIGPGNYAFGFGDILGPIITDIAQIGKTALSQKLAQVLGVGGPVRTTTSPFLPGAGVGIGQPTLASALALAAKYGPAAVALIAKYGARVVQLLAAGWTIEQILEALGVRGGAGLIGAGVGKRYRRMNVLNPRALRRSMRRVKGFAKFAGDTMTFTKTHRMKTRRRR